MVLKETSTIGFEISFFILLQLGSTALWDYGASKSKFDAELLKCN